MGHALQHPGTSGIPSKKRELVPKQLGTAPVQLTIDLTSRPTPRPPEKSANQRCIFVDFEVINNLSGLNIATIRAALEKLVPFLLVSRPTGTIIRTTRTHVIELASGLRSVLLKHEPKEEIMSVEVAGDKIVISSSPVPPTSAPTGKSVAHQDLGYK